MPKLRHDNDDFLPRKKAKIEFSSNLLTQESIPSLIWEKVLNNLSSRDLASFALVGRTFHGLFANKQLSQALIEKKKLGFYQIFTEDFHTFLLCNNPEKSILYATGKNDHGQLATGDYENKNFFIPCRLPSDLKLIEELKTGLSHTFIRGRNVQGNPIVAATGLDLIGNLGIEKANEEINIFTPCVLPPDFKSIEGIRIGGLQIFIWGKNAKGEPVVAATGRNEYGQLATGDFANKNCFTLCILPTGLNSIDALHVNYNMTFIRGRDTQGNPMLAAAGWNKFGQLATGDNIDKNSFTPCVLPPQLRSVEALYVGYNSCIIQGRDAQGNPMIAAAGWNKYGQLATGDDINKHSFTPCKLPPSLKSIVGLKKKKGNGIFIWGKNAKGEPVIAAAGRNEYGQLAIRNNTNQNFFTPCTLPADLKSIAGLRLGSNVTFIWGLNTQKNLVLAAAGENSNGQLATGDNTHKNSFTHCKIPPNLKSIEAIKIKGESTIIQGRDAQGNSVLVAAGKNNCGQLATGDNINKNSFTPCKLPPGLKSIEKLHASPFFTVLRGRNDKGRLIVAAAGNNADGQLGIGNNRSQNYFTPCSNSAQRN